MKDLKTVLRLAREASLKKAKAAMERLKDNGNKKSELQDTNI
jgi:hypothetical protein